MLSGLTDSWRHLSYNQFTKPAADTQTNNKKKIAEPLNVIPVAERPYMQISPVADGRNIQIIVKEVKKPAESVDYELNIRLVHFCKVFLARCN